MNSDYLKQFDVTQKAVEKAIPFTSDRKFDSHIFNIEEVNDAFYEMFKLCEMTDMKKERPDIWKELVEHKRKVDHLRDINHG